MPSPTCRTVPTSARSVWTSYCSIRWRRIEVISSGRSFKALSAPHKCLSKSFQSSAHARIREVRARLQHDAADDRGIDLARRLDLSPGGLLDLLDDAACLVVRELARRRQLDRQPPLLARDQPLELARDVLDLAGAGRLRDDEQEVLEQLVVVPGEISEDAGLRRRFELRIPKNRAELGGLRDRVREVGERLVHLVQTAGVLRRLEQGLRINAVRSCYFPSSSREKSSVPIACEMSSRSRSESSFWPTTIEVA